MKDFVKISRYSGMREDLVQAGGGNSSFKITEERMVIKASGYQLADLSEDDGYALVNPKIIRDRFLETVDLGEMDEKRSKGILEEAFIEGKRPSIETFLHAVSGKYTLHTHPIVVNVLTSRKNGMEVLGELFPEALMVPYATPGVELAKAYFESYKTSISKKEKKTDVVFLQNHGLVVSADTAEGVIEKTESITKIIEKYLGINFLSLHRATELWALFPDKIVWKVNDKNIISTFNEIGEWNHSFCPDCVVYLGKAFLNLSDKPDDLELKNFIDVFGEPVMINYMGDLYIVAESVKKAMEIQSVMSFSAQVMKLNRQNECNFLSDKEQNYLLGWDAEKYRRKMR